MDSTLATILQNLETSQGQFIALPRNINATDFRKVRYLKFAKIDHTIPRTFTFFSPFPGEKNLVLPNKAQIKSDFEKMKCGPVADPEEQISNTTNLYCFYYKNDHIWTYKTENFIYVLYCINETKFAFLNIFKLDDHERYRCFINSWEVSFKLTDTTGFYDRLESKNLFQ